MAEIVFAAGVPHAPALVGLLDKAPEPARQVVLRTYQNVQRRLQASRADVLIVFANDHLTNNRIRSYPDFVIGAAPLHRGPHEWFQPWIGCRDYEIKGNPEVAKALLKGMSRRGVKMFLEMKPLNFDDNISVPTVRMDLDRMGITLVPVLQNCFLPPVPDQRQCYEIGRSVGDFVRNDLPAGLRVALMGSGGLSHEPGGARYISVDEEFDRTFLDLCARGDHARLLREMTIERMESAGVGGTAELVSWFIVMGAIGECTGESFGNTVGWPSSRCGAGGVIWRHEQARELPRDQAPAPRTAGTAAWKNLDPALASHDLVQDLKWNPQLREQFKRDESSVLDQYGLKPEERKAIEERDFRRLYDLGIHPYLGGQLSRLIFGNDAGKGAIEAANKLVASLTGKR